MRFDRIRKLFALAADQSDTPEGETAARVARRLMHEHDVQLSQLSPQQREDADPFTRQTLLLGGSEQWRCRLLSVVARHGECVASWRPGAGQGSLYGRRSSVEVTEYLFVVLSRDGARGRRRPAAAPIILILRMAHQPGRGGHPIVASVDGGHCARLEKPFRHNSKAWLAEQ